MTLKPVTSGSSTPSDGTEFVIEEGGKMVCGRYTQLSFSSFHFSDFFSIVVCPPSKGKFCHLDGAPTLMKISLKRALERVNAGPGGSNTVYWTSLREVSSSDGPKGYMLNITRSLSFMSPGGPMSCVLSIAHWKTWSGYLHLLVMILTDSQSEPRV